MPARKTASADEPRPEPVPMQVKCSVCAQDWDKHGDNPTVVDCVRVLKAELAKRPYNNNSTTGTLRIA